MCESVNVECVNVESVNVTDMRPYNHRASVLVSAEGAKYNSIG